MTTVPIKLSAGLDTAELPPRTCQAFRAAAAARGTDAVALAARVLSIVARDKLFAAVLDDEQPRAPSRTLER